MNFEYKIEESPFPKMIAKHNCFCEMFPYDPNDLKPCGSCGLTRQQRKYLTKKEAEEFTCAYNKMKKAISAKRKKEIEEHELMIKKELE